MKRLLKAFVILGMLIAGILLIIRWLERDGDDGGRPEPAWPPAPPPEPSGVAEEMVSVVDEPIAVETEPAPEAEPEAEAETAEAHAVVERGEALTDELLGQDAPSPTEPFDADAVEPVVEPDDVLAEARDEGMPVPEAEVPETPAVEDAAAQVAHGTELEADLLGAVAPAPEEMPSPTETEAQLSPDEVLAEARDEGMPVPEAEVEAPPEGGAPATDEAQGEHAPDDFLTRAFLDLAATPEEAEEPAPTSPPEAMATPAVEASSPVAPEPEAPASAESAPESPPPAPEAPSAIAEPRPSDDPRGGWGPAEAVAQPLSAGAGSGPDLELADTLEQAMSDLGPGAITPRPARNAESFLDEGNVYFNVGQYSLAIDRYTKAVELDDTLTAAYYNRANARTRAGEFDFALEDYDRALRLAPNDADALNNRGMLHLYRQNYAAALRDFNAALTEDPADTTVMVNRGLAHLHGGDPARAVEDFNEATTLDPGDAAAHYGTAQANATLGRRDDALAAVERALTIDQGYAREAAADPRLAILQGDEEFMRLLRQAGR